MAKDQPLRLPLDTPRTDSGVDVVTARALRLALWSDVPVRAAAEELRRTADEDATVLAAALARVERALAAQWSDIAARAAIELRAARDAA